MINKVHSCSCFLIHKIARSDASSVVFWLRFVDIANGFDSYLGPISSESSDEPDCLKSSSVYGLFAFRVKQAKKARSI